MELKNYQKLVLKDIDAYLDALMKTDGINAAWKEYWASKGIGAGFAAYYDDLAGAPNVCIKVPTGGGKTFLAASSVKTVFDKLPTGKTKFVVWLVPSDAILTQTVANLSNPNHPYRQRLDRDFGGCVNVYTKEQLLNAQNFKPADVMENLSIAIFCYASIRANPKSKDDKKIYQENGNLLGFAEMFNDKELLLADTPDTALLQVIRQMNPVVVVDESHNAKSELSIAMLQNLNPSFVLSMTATPTKRSNIISYVNARELKKENIDIPKQDDVETQTNTDAAIGEIINTAEAQGDDYEQKNKEAGDDGLFNLGVPNVKIHRVQPEFAAEAAQLEIPQFMVQDDAGMFGGDELLVPLNETALLDGFTLAAKDAAVPFNLAVSGAVRVDISESGDVTPKCKQLTKSELEYFSAQLATKTTDDRINVLLDMAATQLDSKIDFCQKKEIKDYVVRVAQQLPAAERNQLSLELLPSFVQCVRDKIDKLAKQHKRLAFSDKINQNVVVCKANYKLPQTIQPIPAVTYIEKSLYTGEYADMNPEEFSVIQAIASKENVKWWHRIKDRKGFCINGFINHYPDFMVYTDKGNVVLVEYKGADRDGSDSQAKAELGRIWADNAGQKYKYFMVFLKDGDAVQGALKIDAFLNTIEKL